MYDPLFIDRLAWTFAHKPELYAKHQAAPEAPQSAIGIATNAFMQPVNNENWSAKTIYHHVIHVLEEASKKGVWMEKPILDFFANGYKTQPPELKMILWPGAFISCGLFSPTGELTKERANEWEQQLHLGKLGYYSKQLTLALYMIRSWKDLTKLDINNPALQKYYQCLAEAEDYWSALDNAFHVEGYAPYNGIIVGAIAEAMYGEKTD